MIDFRKILGITMGLALLTGTGWADEASMEKELDRVKQRLEVLENKTEAAETQEAQTSGSILDRITVHGILAGAYQYESAWGSSGAKDFGRGAVPAQLEVSIEPQEGDEIFLKFGFATGNGLNMNDHSFALAPWAADLEDDVKDINGRNRDYLLTVWYKHTFEIDEGNTVGITGGIIDATDYLDENAFANDEFTQFMNEALVNGPNTFLPSYDIGGAIEWESGPLAIKGVVMNVGENEDGNSYRFYGAQVGYTIETPMGEGNYRVLINATSDDFSDPDGGGNEGLQGLFLSCDQMFGEILGAWIRFGWSDDKALVDFRDLYSGGIDVNGSLWGREQDNAGIGYAFLRGGNGVIHRTHVAEAYVRVALSQVFAMTFDLQYLTDDYNARVSGDPKGWISGVRLTAEF